MKIDPGGQQQRLPANEGYVRLNDTSMPFEYLYHTVNHFSQFRQAYTAGNLQQEDA